MPAGAPPVSLPASPAAVPSVWKWPRFVSFNTSALARKIVIFNLVALVVMIAGVLHLNPFRDSLVLQRERGLVTEAALVAEVFEAGLEPGATLAERAPATLATLALPSGIEVFVFGPEGALLATTVDGGREPRAVNGLRTDERSTVITSALGRLWAAISTRLAPPAAPPTLRLEDGARALLPAALGGGLHVRTGPDAAGNTIFTVASRVRQGGAVAGVVAIASPAGELDELVRREREQVLQMFAIAALVSVGLSLVLASAIATPLSDLAVAVEGGRANPRGGRTRVQIPDLSARPDEIGRLSAALRAMVAALYERVEVNEQFAADVAHEIKNPLASLRSAVGALRVARDDQRLKLIGVIEHDVRRLDRLVSDISNASRLDSELVREEEQEFDLAALVGSIACHCEAGMEEKGIELITDLPQTRIPVTGLEARLAQVLVNLLENAKSFCDEGDAIRVWVRRRDRRVLLVVEDTGPGIPEVALRRIFERFYSERPEGQFGNNSGLGLAISRQIVEAHGGVIWAENIRPTEADPLSEPLGARFVVGLPV